MTDTEQRPQLDAGNYLAGLKGVTIPSTAPSFNEDPRKGRHWSSDNAINADDESIKSIFASLKSMPTLKDVPVDVPDRCLRNSGNRQCRIRSRCSKRRGAGTAGTTVASAY